MGDSSLTRSHNESVLRSLKRGDLVEFPRVVISHWAVYLGNEEVVHLAGVGKGRSGASVASSASSFSIGGVLFNKAKVCRDNFWNVAKGSKARKNNSKDGKLSPFSADEIEQNAISQLGRVGYNLITANCESFAKWCRYGTPQSDQVERAIIKVGMFAGIWMLGLSLCQLLSGIFRNRESNQESKRKVLQKR